MTEDPKKNPFVDWNFIYVFYCDGSIFVGDNIYKSDIKGFYQKGNAFFTSVI